MFNLKKVNKEKIRLISEILFLIIFLVLFKQKALQKWILIFGITLFISLVFNRLYCGWVCPMETLFRPINWFYKKTGIKRIKTPDFFKNTWVRWSILIIFVLTMIVFKIFEIKINLLLYIIILSVMITLIFEEEMWHKHICPYGTSLALFSRPAKYGLYINEKKCISCGLCEKTCPVNTIFVQDNNKRYIYNKECLNCFKCQYVCPVDAIDYGKLKQE